MWFTYLVIDFIATLRMTPSIAASLQPAPLNAATSASLTKPRVRNRAALPHRSNHRVIERLAFGNGSVRGHTEVAVVLDAGRNLDDLELQRIDFSTAC
jgi:hypothetical protein